MCDHLNSVSFLVGLGLPFFTIWLMCTCLSPCPQADHLTRRGKPLPQQESVEIELAEEKPTKRSIITVEELTEIERLEDLDTCMVRHIPQPIWLSMQITGRKKCFSKWHLAISWYQETEVRNWLLEGINVYLWTFCQSCILLFSKGKAFAFSSLLLSWYLFNGLFFAYIATIKLQWTTFPLATLTWVQLQ